jgi:hypothetical protein
MPSRVTIFRIAAIAILLLTGVEDSGDSCLCCCFHIVVIAPLVFEPVQEAVAFEPILSPQVPSFASARIYHPPKA